MSWNGVPISRLTSFKAQYGSAVYEEVTNVTSTVVGTGANSRTLKQYDCVAVEPGTVEVGIFGCPPFSVSDKGKRGTLLVSFDGGTVSGDAFLDDFDVSGQVGQFLVGTARFRFCAA